MATSDQNPIIGREVDGYRIQGVLGQGGMGVVYQAEDIELSRTVALKMIAPHVAGDEHFLRRFRTEARALARVNSPYIVGVYALRQTPHGVFIVMEYVEGGTLGDLINQGPMPWKKAVPIIKQMLMAFRDAHSLSVIHRDIKPNNIMLSQDGVVKVTDFGLAKVYAQGGDATVTEGVAGTLYYMSPEQVQGLPNLDHRADLYSLGMTIYEMLTGEVPFDKGGSQYATLKKIVEGNLPPVRERVSNIPPEVEQFVMKSLARDPADRFQSAEEMLRTVEALEGGDQRARPVQDRTPVPQPGPGKRKTLPILLGVLAVLVVAGGYLAYRALSSDAPPSLTVTSTPPGATVFVDRIRAGETPLQAHELPEITEGRQNVALRLELAGHLTLDTLVAVSAGEQATFNFALAERAAEPEVNLVIDSRPGAAGVWIDDQYVGETPYTVVLPVSATPSVRVQKDGYTTWRRNAVALSTERDNTLMAALERTRVPDDNNNNNGGDDNPPVVQRGSLSLSASPNGEMFVDNNPAGQGTVALDAGRHNVSCGRQPFRADTTVTVLANETTSLTCYFQSTVNILTTREGSPAPWASVWVDGVNVQETPYSRPMGVGSYKIEVRREGYEIVDPETTLVILPTFKEKTHRLPFRVQ